MIGKIRRYHILVMMLIVMQQLTISMSNASGNVLAQDDLYLTPNRYTEGSQIERIQRAVADAKYSTGKVVIPKYDSVEKTDVWLLDEAILLSSNMQLELHNCKLKLSDVCRDNFIRSANAGLGISDIAPLENIKIIGKGHVLLEGADNPRSTGDHNKILSTHPDKGHRYSYGSDAGKAGENQKGGWRNHAIILAHVDGFEISGIQLKDYHAHGIVLERSKNGVISDITFDVRQAVSVDGTDRLILNQDGIGIRFGSKNIIIDNCKGKSGDDFINIGLTDTGAGAGEENVNVVSGSIYTGQIDDISNIYLQNWQDFYSISHRAIRIMPIGHLRISNVFIENMTINELSNQGLVVEYTNNIKRLFVRNVITHRPIIAKGISDASFRDIYYIGEGEPIDVSNSEKVLVENVKKVLQ